jgi:hypothetical protein
MSLQSVLLLVLASAFAPGATRPQPFYLNTASGVKYVGSKVCARCHGAICKEFSQTPMGRSMVLPSDPSLPLLSAPVKVHDPRSGLDYEIYRSGSSLYQSQSEEDAEGNFVFTETHRIAYAIGAGIDGVGYLVREGNHILEAPLSYYTQTHGWGLSPAYAGKEVGFDRQVMTECLTCHSGRPRPMAGGWGAYDNPPFEQLAIGCENCHGPGSLHVKERTNRGPLPGTLDRSIVNPADLPSWLADNICMRCHEDGDMHVLQPGKALQDFRPGTPLDHTVAIFSIPFTPQSPPQSALLHQYMQMILSKCYLRTNGKMTCITCHDPHFEPTASEAPAYYRKKCLMCHTEQSCTVPLARRIRQSPPDDCITCHMPREKLRTISHSALTNHRIIAYQGEPFPNAAFHMTTPRLPDTVLLDRIPEKGQPNLPPIVLLQAYRELVAEHPAYSTPYNRLLDQLVKTQPQNPIVLSALATREALAGNPARLAEAQDDMRRAVAAGATTPVDVSFYASLLIRAGSMAQAVSILQREIAKDPYSAAAYATLMSVYVKLKEYRLALQTMEQYLKLFPQDSTTRALVGRLQALFSASPQ